MILFEYSDEYARKFGDVSEIKLLTRMFPDEFVRGWEFLIEEISNGYDWDPNELDYDIDGYREPIEHFLFEDCLNSFSDHHKFKTIIAELDSQFLDLTQINPDVQSFDTFPWWQRRMLKYGGRRYIEGLGVKHLALVNLKE